MYKWIMATLMVVGGIMAVVFSFQAAMDKPESLETTDENAIVILGENWEFDKETYEVEAGVPVTITYKDRPGGGNHGVFIEGTNINLGNGDTEEYTFEPGEYKLICSIMCGEGHEGMVSTLVASSPDQTNDGDDNTENNDDDDNETNNMVDPT